jgi:eukaryotic-like serine/threonine-protein kinase
LIAADLNDMRARRNLALSHHRIGYTLVERTQRSREGEEYLSEALAILNALSSADPINGDLARVQTYTLMELGAAYLGQNKAVQALATFEEAYRRFEAYRVADPGDFEAPLAAAHALGQLSEVLLGMKQPRLALERVSEAERLLHQPGSMSDLDLPETHYYKGLVYLQLGKVHTQLIGTEETSARAEHRRLATDAFNKAIEEMKQATEDTVHGSRAKARCAKARLQEAQSLEAGLGVRR